MAIIVRALVDNHVDALLAAVTDETVTRVISPTHRDRSPAGKPFDATGRDLRSRPAFLGTTWSDVDRTSTLGAVLVSNLITSSTAATSSPVTAGPGRAHAGHTNNHLCFAWKSALFNDQVMGWSTTVVSPQTATCVIIFNRVELLDRDDAAYWPTTAMYLDPKVRGGLIEHREQREVAITAALQAGTNTIADSCRHVQGRLD